MDDLITQSMSDLEILLYEMVYGLRLSDQEIIEKLVPNEPSNGLFGFVSEQLDHVRDNPKCPECNVLLEHYSADENFSERYYCPTCLEQYNIKFPHEPIVGGENGD